MAKLKLAINWAAGCGGCDVAILDTNEKLLDIAEVADIVFWPIAMDFKVEDLEKMEPGSIDLCFFNGGIRNSKEEGLARLLREKSKVMVAFGACASWGGIPALANMNTRDEIFHTVYQDTHTTINEKNVYPKPVSCVPEGELHIPELYQRVWSLDQVLDVDYFVPGCPPTPQTIWNAIEIILSGKLPPKGSVIGAGKKSLCDTCKRTKTKKTINKFYRPHEIITDPEICLLEQGVVCSGPVTREGCGHLCINNNMPCRGCYGPSEKVNDHGASLLNAVASIMDASNEAAASKLSGDFDDPAGTVYRFSLAKSLVFDYNKEAKKND
ncbi:F420-non-reducing hydrogenase subunit G [Desulfonispora thiosulfatigenes DSM 11270]|uniref:F420-non-reducing hydrogenase subunit G n=1 Tax=Desulfonispora thiosulfatigenes DSM 11270 TaxID=656914 RepID=A0A1W1VT77_DESTI|nr:oxidoreductase [Desulfonispora thiosulfatigenes]SMB96473.1 F420-non-reducing hydrogenase subunit G [Desulfonispora thiosulfatigenes DSM 11270]